MIDTSASIFWREIFQQPTAVRDCLKANREIFQEIAAEVKRRGIKTVVFVGRGSSDHANLVGRYLFETRCGMIGSICAPSVVTAYKSDIDYSNVLMIAVSQSGGAQDIYQVMKQCDEQGGLCVSVTNVEGSLMTQAGKYKINNHCGPEMSITAGKSYLTQVTIVTALAAYISQDPELLQVLDELEEIVETSLKVLEPQVRDVVRFYRNTEHMILSGRGLMDALANEVELKIQETSYLDARCYGSADYRHGPIATAMRFVPYMFFIADEKTNYCAIDLLKRLKEETHIWCTVVSNKPEIAQMGDTSVVLPENCDGIRGVFAGAIVGQMFSCLCSLSRGFNPDSPKGVSKKTVTV
ncbi:SIS domain-containing protein [Youxingia wuxianensis]|uniref:SIS domain-containing protein n=1 Tax=Youxingia wuxianensis TaxID=2763678 RepID=A0A926EMR2_9FIRM|nr:SIS domain-containing protein [Youxingia wuxianensis]MBC8584768.1 SIS domain-containing protein [Youxingia wuxianensis]